MWYVCLQTRVIPSSKKDCCFWYSTKVFLILLIYKSPVKKFLVLWISVHTHLYTRPSLISLNHMPGLQPLSSREVCFLPYPLQHCKSPSEIFPLGPGEVAQPLRLCGEVWMWEGRCNWGPSQVWNAGLSYGTTWAWSTPNFRKLSCWKTGLLRQMSSAPPNNQQGLFLQSLNEKAKWTAYFCLAVTLLAIKAAW